ncbi:hypothetical protein GQ53DRAFT_320276 [Thozetella sp. PMI_491]|nr:hypothetical protein GQ53DRAFT_320276 [Thozetella sp. PMI_491]
MPFDDDDAPTASPSPAGTMGEPVGGGEEAPTAEEALEEEAQDFRLFKSLFRKKANISAQTIRKGEKDFESHGTRAQETALEQSRQAMEEAMSFTRVHLPKDYVRGWYFPDWWADWEGPDRAPKAGHGRKPELDGAKPAEDPFVRDRVVLLESTKGIARNMGRAVTGQAKDRPARGLDWLLPEEALFLVERGDLDLWWPTRSLEKMFPAPKQTTESPQGEDGGPALPGDADQYDEGIPLSLQTAYSLLIGGEGERGKISLQKYQVFASLRRMGYILQRAPRTIPTREQPLGSRGDALREWLFSFIPAWAEDKRPPYGPLIRPGLYRSYQTVYKQLAIIARHKPTPCATSSFETRDPYRIFYHVWKGSTEWKKTSPPPPDFYMAVVDAHDTAVPTFEEMVALVDATPFLPPKATWNGPRMLYPRLKHGYRQVLVAVVDHSVINYMRFGEGAFGEEPLFPRFDRQVAPRGAKGGGRGGGRGGARGGRGGRGRGRGGRR